ncbi:hypothetical protein BGLA2_2170035 [Burkholderia gladioli]|nr:hypothetical protein BGLA2_2170035 [Burkholderia gladioli]
MRDEKLRSGPRARRRRLDSLDVMGHVTPRCVNEIRLFNLSLAGKPVERSKR